MAKAQCCPKIATGCSCWLSSAQVKGSFVPIPKSAQICAANLRHEDARGRGVVPSLLLRSEPEQEALGISEAFAGLSVFQ